MTISLTGRKISQNKWCLGVVKLLNKVTTIPKRRVTVQFEVLLIDHPHILHLLQVRKITFQGRQFKILPIIVRQNGNAVVQLKAVGVGCVIDQHHSSQLPIDPSQVLDVEIVDVDAVLPVQSMMENLSIRIDFIEDGVSIVFMTGSEDHHLPFLAHLLQKGKRVGTNKDIQIYLFPLDHHLQFQIRLALSVIQTMDESLIKIDEQRLSAILPVRKQDGRVLILYDLFDVLALLKERYGGVDVFNGKRVLLVPRTHYFCEIVLVVLQAGVGIDGESGDIVGLGVVRNKLLFSTLALRLLRNVIRCQHPLRCDFVLEEKGLLTLQLGLLLLPVLVGHPHAHLLLRLVQLLLQ